MSGKTTIEWTWMPGYVGGVWNPTTGCTRVSAGCDNCYAFALHDKRYKANLDAARKAIGPTNDVLSQREAIREVRYEHPDARLPFPKQYDLPFSRVQLLEDRIDVPLRTRKPTCYFVDSMADLFHEDVPDEYLDRVWATMDAAQRHVFLILTKRPERMALYVAGRSRIAGTPYLPLGNAWLGTSIEDQKSADERIPRLLATPASVRFLSCEPLLGPIDLARAHPHGYYCDESAECPSGEHDHEFTTPGMNTRISWVIIGGESGARARPMDLAWARSLVAQCRAAGVAVFVKQIGAKPYEKFAASLDGNVPWHKRESHGRDLSEWPEDLRVREWPTTTVSACQR